MIVKTGQTLSREGRYFVCLEEINESIQIEVRSTISAVVLMKDLKINMEVMRVSDCEFEVGR